jgi:hypothetical protein
MTFGVGVTLEVLNLKDARKDAMSLTAIVDWLLSSHLHFVLTYPHEGFAFTTWSMENIYYEFNRLRIHAGFPQNMRCPIITQDKFAYLELLPEDLKLPTYKILVAETMDYENEIRR